MKIQKELDETKIVLHKTIESVLERGETVDSLVEKSDGLSAQSKMFYKQVGDLPFFFLVVHWILEHRLTIMGCAGEATELVLCSHVSGSW